MLAQLEEWLRVTCFEAVWNENICDVAAVLIHVTKAICSALHNYTLLKGELRWGDKPVEDPPRFSYSWRSSSAGQEAKDRRQWHVAVEVLENLLGAPARDIRLLLKKQQATLPAHRATQTGGEWVRQTVPGMQQTEVS